MTKRRKFTPECKANVVRINRAFKEATVKRYHYDQLRENLQIFADVYNFA